MTVRLTVNPGKIEGHWAVSASGTRPLRQHFVPLGSEQWRDATEGWPMGYVAPCGRNTMAASAEYRRGIPVCEDCSRLVPHPLEHRC